MRFNPSFLKVWQDCQLKGKFEHIDEYPRRQHIKATFGSCIHHALELYNLTGDVEESKKRFLHLWQHPEEINATPQDFGQYQMGTLRAKGLEILDNYHEKTILETREVIATEHRFCVPIGNHEVSGIVDLVEWRISGRGIPILGIVDYKTNTKKPTLNDLRLDLQFCADEETEILTKRGWLKYNEVIVGEDVLTLNQELDIAEWQPATSVNKFNVVNQDLVSLEGKAHSSLTTANHRWPVTHIVSGKKGWYKQKRIVRSDALTGSDRITCGAPVVNLPTERKYPDALVELVGWYWTEGFQMNGGSLSFSQSSKIYPENIEKIRKTLIDLYGSGLLSLRNSRSPRKSLEYPAWRESNDQDVTRFYLNRVASQDLKVAFKDTKSKVIDPLFISDLTLDQLNKLAEISILADGSSRSNCDVICQSKKDRLDSMQMIYSLMGSRSSLRKRNIGGAGVYAGREFWALSEKKRNRFFCPRKSVRSTVKYTGIVWCPTTYNQTWLARRNGQVYFTGNTVYVYASMQSEFWLGYEPEIEKYTPINDNAEESWDLFRDMPRRAIWYHLWGSQSIDAGDRDQFDFERLYRLLDAIENAVEKEVFVPSIRPDSCLFCGFKEQCPAVIPILHKLKEPVDEEENML